MQLAELGLRSWAEERWLDVPPLPGTLTRRETMSRVDSRCPAPDGTLEPVTLRRVRDLPRPPAPSRSRVAFAAAHVVADPRRDVDFAAAAIDWESTLAFRRHLWSYGLGVAEAMDTAQRGMGPGLGNGAGADPPRSRAERRAAFGGAIAAWRGHRPPDPGRSVTLDDVDAPTPEQVGFVEARGRAASS